MIETVGTIVLEKATEAAIHALRERIAAEPALEGSRLVAVAETSRGALADHLRRVSSWSSIVKFRDLSRGKSLAQIYIALDTYVMPARDHLDMSEREHARPLERAIEEAPHHVVLLGQPGSGKTTSMQKICGDYFRNGKVLNNFRFPIVVRLRELRKEETFSEIGPIYKAIQSVFKLAFEIPPRVLAKDHVPAQKLILERYLESMRSLVVLDGFDELPDSPAKQRVLTDFRDLCEALHDTKVVLTSRSADFPFDIQRAERMEIRPLTKEQISSFSQKWLVDQAKEEDFLKKVFASPFYDTAMRPLTLAHLCAIYERTGDIPDRPKTVYRKVTQLLLEEWDQQRDVRRPSAYSNFGTDRKLEFLSHLSFCLGAESGATTFSHEDLERAYEEPAKELGLPASEAKQVAVEIESHSGLLLQSGFDAYEFSHKSIQEFLTAEYLVRLPSIHVILYGIRHMPSELAVAVSLSSRPTDFFSEVVLKWLRRVHLTDPRAFYRAFLSRLDLERPTLYCNRASLLAAVLAEAIAGMASDDSPVLKQITSSSGQFHLGGLYRLERSGPGGVVLEATAEDPNDLVPRVLTFSAEAFARIHTRFGL